jgi:hypothetical protein
MVNLQLGRLPALARTPHRLNGMLAHGDLLSAHQPRLSEIPHATRVLQAKRTAALARWLWPH